MPFRAYEKRDYLRGENLKGPIVAEIEGVDQRGNFYYVGAQKITGFDGWWVLKAIRQWGCSFLDDDGGGWVGAKVKLSPKHITTKAGKEMTVVDIEPLTPPPHMVAQPAGHHGATDDIGSPF